MRVMRMNSSIEVVYIWTIAGSLSFSLSGGFRWFPLVTAGYPWLPHGHFIWPRLQKISANDRFLRGTLANFCKSKKCIIFNIDSRV